MMGGASPLAESRRTSLVVLVIVDTALGWTAASTRGVEPVVLSDSGEEGSKSSRERLAIFKS